MKYEAELDALVHCKMYLQEYVNAEVERDKQGGIMKTIK